MRFLSIARACLIALVALLTSAASPAALEWAGVPAVVRNAVEAAFPGLRVDEVESDARDGVPFYTVRGDANGAVVELEITGEGVILTALATGGYEDDHDHDGMRDDEESAHGCDPGDPDTDDDAYPDGFELTRGSDPLDPACQPRILSIATRDLGNGARCLVVSVETFVSGAFRLEFSDGTGGWAVVGEPWTGDGATADVEIPLAMANPGGLFRVSVQADSEESASGGTGVTGSVPCASPETIQGLTVIVRDDDGETHTYVMLTATTGALTEEENGQVDFYPFDYTYEKTGPCSGTIRIVFPSDDGETKGVVLDLAYTAEGVGNVTLRRFEGLQVEDPETGTFQFASP